jgi:DNA polymerase-1
MMQEIIEGRDQHAFTCTELMELPLTKENRTDAKIFNFRAIYADPETAAYAYFMDPRMPNFSQRKWDKILRGFFDHYRGMVSAHSRWVQEVRTTGRFVGPTGRHWTFKKKLKRGIMDYSVSDIYNYPVQGSAGDLIKLALIKIRKQLQERQMRSLLVNTVHDSIIFDAPDDEVELLASIVMEVFHKIPALAAQYFDWHISVPITGEVGAGPSWGEMKLIQLGAKQ